MKLPEILKEVADRIKEHEGGDYRKIPMMDTPAGGEAYLDWICHFLAESLENYLSELGLDREYSIADDDEARQTGSDAYRRMTKRMTDAKKESEFWNSLWREVPQDIRYRIVQNRLYKNELDNG